MTQPPVDPRSPAQARAAEERYRKLFEAMDEGFCLIELLYDSAGAPINYRFLQTNPAFESHSGLVGAAGKTILELVPNFEAQWFAAYHQVAVTGQPLKFESEFKSMGHWFDVSVTRMDGAGQLAIFFKDITVRKAAEDRLTKSEERFKSLFESIDEGFCVVDVVYDGAGKAVDYLMLQNNPAFSRHTGLNLGSERSARATIPDLEEHWVTTFHDVVHTGKSQRLINHAKGLGRTFEVFANRIGGPGSTQAAIVFTDVTEKMRADRELRDMAAALSEADRQKNDFLATLAHELRNPLAPISNGLHLLQRSGGPEVAETVQMMARQVNQMVHLVNDLLDVARISTGKIELKKADAELGAIVANAVETSRPAIDAGGHTLTTTLPAVPVRLHVDPIRIAQAIGNLLSNAAKYASAPGLIDMAVRLNGANAEIVVSDAGIGIAKESLDSVFSMFTQIKQEQGLAQGGLGIGLSLVRKLMELHGGTVSASSPGVGQGSTFTLTLPVSDAPVKPAQPAALDARTKDAAGFKVLVVDDNHDAAESLAEVLGLMGHTAAMARDGREALQVAADFAPDVVFLDIGLPELNGYEVAAALRKQPGGAHYTLIALTGWGTEEDRTRASAAGFNHHLVKPADMSAIDRLMNGISAARG